MFLRKHVSDHICNQIHLALEFLIVKNLGSSYLSVSHKHLKNELGWAMQAILRHFDSKPFAVHYQKIHSFYLTEIH